MRASVQGCAHPLPAVRQAGPLGSDHAKLDRLQTPNPGESQNCRKISRFHKVRAEKVQNLPIAFVTVPVVTRRTDPHSSRNTLELRLEKNFAEESPLASHYF